MNIYIDTIGCRLNQAEIEQFARQFLAAGHALVGDPREADLAVVNTCAVTASAASDSRQKVRQIARAGGEVLDVVVTGCWSTLKPHEAAALPRVRKVIPNLHKDTLVSDLLDLPPETFDIEPVERELKPGIRLRTRAFIKVQDGCDNRCTFCVTTLARGAGRSRPAPAVLADVCAALQGGAQEIVLTGVHLGSWGHDLHPAAHLKSLVETILRETETPRLRLSSLEPWDLEAGFFALWEDTRLCRHLHLPLQSGCAATLRRMARKTTPHSFAGLVAAARAAIPGVAITTDVIAGFPGESEAEFEESMAFVQFMDFAGGHIFTYSARDGTAAARMPGQVAHSVSKERGARLRAAVSGSAANYADSFLGAILPVLWEGSAKLGPRGWEMSGLTDNYLRVQAHAPRHLWNQITPVQIQHRQEDTLSGVIFPHV